MNYDTSVDFDLAVTTINTTSEDKSIGGGLRISIVGANAASKNSSRGSQEITSRVKFNVHLRREINSHLTRK